jgi:cyclophilin family peptidyl-prolyl cis-trans isomerase
MPRRLLPLALVATLPIAACGSSGKSTPSDKTASATPTTKTTYHPTKDDAGCVKVAKPASKGPGSLKKPTLRLSAAKHYTVTLLTNCGTIVMRLDVKHAPKTTSSFASLVKKGFFDDLTFHRIVPGFVIQGGDPLGTGQGGPGYNIVERPPASLKYTRGVVAMAKAQNDPPGASGSQFFIVTVKNAGLPPQYALVGKVVSGMATVDKIITEPTDSNGLPSSPVVIQKATLGVR